MLDAGVSYSLAGIRRLFSSGRNTLCHWAPAAHGLLLQQHTHTLPFKPALLVQRYGTLFGRTTQHASPSKSMHIAEQRFSAGQAPAQLQSITPRHACRPVQQNSLGSTSDRQGCIASRPTLLTTDRQGCTTSRHTPEPVELQRTNPASAPLHAMPVKSEASGMTQCLSSIASARLLHTHGRRNIGERPTPAREWLLKAAAQRSSPFGRNAHIGAPYSQCPRSPTNSGLSFREPLLSRHALQARGFASAASAGCSSATCPLLGTQTRVKVSSADGITASRMPMPVRMASSARCTTHWGPSPVNVDSSAGTTVSILSAPLRVSSRAWCTAPGVQDTLSTHMRLYSSAARKPSPLGEKSNAQALYLLAMVVLMVGLTYASVPLYRMFCQATGFGGTVQEGLRVEAKLKSREEAKNESLEKAAAARELTVSFNADVSDGLPWRFTPVQRSVRVKPGQATLVFYNAENRSNHAITGVSTYNVAPQQAGLYFNKIQCFCFEEQKLRPGEKIDMPVFFYIDPEYALDARLKGIDHLTLSYTFFKVDEEEGSVTTIGH
eukprot:jgi/Botrbrau1/5113/Bobra.0128s0023.3